MFRLPQLLILSATLLLPNLLAADNPPAPGFNLVGSDPEAIAIADQVMDRMGGRAAWDNTHYITWRFFGGRRHVWDKFTGDIRVEGTDRETDKTFLILMNIHTRQGRAWSAGTEITDPVELAKRLDYGEAVWINDGYWIFMPYKLKDSGVTLKYLGERTMLDGRPAKVLQLTFEGVGRTPENKYFVYVAEDSGLVEQWDFFDSAENSEPGFQNPWHNWRTYGEILLSDSRGERGHTDIAVFSELPAAVLHSPEPVDWDALIPE
jgi:hypothetical protein